MPGSGAYSRLVRNAVLLALVLSVAGCGSATRSGGTEGQLSDVAYGWSDAEYPPPHEYAPWVHRPVGGGDGGNVTPEEQARAEEVDARRDAPPHFNDGD